MRSPASMDIIQLDITNRCHLRCSACTRMVAHQPTFSEMTIEQVEQAVLSVNEWYQPGRVLGLIGGEPTMHSQFEPLVRRYAELWGRRTLAANGRAPIEDMNAYVNQRLADRSSGRGLWSSLGPAYYKHFELIQDVFDNQTVNTHDNPGLHKAVLITRKEVGISDADWIPMRDACWVQNLWSASINHHGAYFCEVAASLDNLYHGGKHAWKVEPNWWRRTPAEFGDQLELCELCACAIPNMPSIQANLDTDLVSPQHLVQLQAIGSPAIRKEAYEVVDTNAPATPRQPTTDWYLPTADEQAPDANLDRVWEHHRSCHPKSLTAIVVSVGCADQLAETITHNVNLVDRLIVVTTPDDLHTPQALLEAYIDWKKVKLVQSNRCYDQDDTFNKGRLLNDALAALNHPDWILFTDADIFLPSNLRDFMAEHVLNPGCLYFTPRAELDQSGFYFRHPLGYFQLWHPRAQAIRDHKPFVSEAFCSAAGVDTHFAFQWPGDKLVPIGNMVCTHISHQPRWNAAPRRGWRQCGMLVRDGLIPVHGGISRYPARLRLTDTKFANSVTIDFQANDTIPKHILDENDRDGLVFLGHDIGICHIHVAEFIEEPTC